MTVCRYGGPGGNHFLLTLLAHIRPVSNIKNLTPSIVCLLIARANMALTSVENDCPFLYVLNGYGGVHCSPPELCRWNKVVVLAVRSSELINDVFRR